MKCTCAIVSDGEHGQLIKYCPLHNAGPELVRVISELLSLVHQKRLGAVVALGTPKGMQPIDELVEAAFEELKRVHRPLAALYYFEYRRGISGLPDAGPPEQ